MKTIILAGGLGTRLRHLVPDLPKPMAPVAGRPFLEYLIERLIDAGLRDIILSVGYRAEAIRKHFGSSWATASIAYAEENEPLGTGGALAFSTLDLPEEDVLVLNGDTFLDLDFGELLDFHGRKPQNCLMTMALREVSNAERYGAVQCDAGIVVGYLEKGRAGPGLINAGVCVLRTDLFRRFGLAGKFSFETDLMQAHVAELRPAAFVTDSFFIDIGVEQDFIRAQTQVPQQFQRVPP